MDEEQTERIHRNTEKLHGKMLTWEEQLSVMRTLFPFVSTKAALQEKHFVRGYACSCWIFAMETREEREFMKQYLGVALTEYQRSYEEAGTPEAIANLLWCLCVGSFFRAEGELSEGKRREYTKDCYETGMLLIDILREYKAYEELAKYYGTLLNVVGTGGNAVGVERSKKVG